MPRPADAAPWGSKSTMSTLRPYCASAAPRLIVVVVLPTPPFWLHIAMIRAGPWPASGGGSGKSGAGAGSKRALFIVPNLLVFALLPKPPRRKPPSRCLQSARVGGDVDLTDRDST